MIRDRSLLSLIMSWGQANLWIVLWIMLQMTAGNSGKCGKSVKRDQKPVLDRCGKVYTFLDFFWTGFWSRFTDFPHFPEFLAVIWSIIPPFHIVYFRFWRYFRYVMTWERERDVASHLYNQSPLLPSLYLKFGLKSPTEIFSTYPGIEVIVALCRMALFRA